jgi:hypothetical protein
MRRSSTAKERTAEEVGARPGRPTKIDVGLGSKIEALVAEGLPLREVAARVGVHPRTILRRAAADPEFGTPTPGLARLPSKPYSRSLRASPARKPHHAP